MAEPHAHTKIVAGLVASAGGLQPLRRVLADLSRGAGVAVLVVQHLDRNQPSVLAELLGDVSELSVAQASDGTVVEPDAVYVIPPNATLTLEQDVLRVKPLPTDAGTHHLGDLLLQSMARAFGSRAVGVVLSGTGSDGTAGLHAIRRAGGLAIAQRPAEAASSAMPRHAIVAGATDVSLPTKDIAARICAHAGRSPDANGAVAEDTIADRLDHLCTLLAERTDHDFRQYKPGTLVRRIRRRMLAVHAPTVAEYEAELARSPTEAQLLLGEMLISVTQFFRDPAVFDLLAERVLPAICQGPPDAAVRIWVPGCASGEETYSLAILAREHLSRQGSPRPLQIFGTDVDTEALKVAREGQYSEEAMAGVSPARRERFFSRMGDGYRVTKELRDACIFSMQNLVRDPPFSNLDLISCRNVFIYLQADLQRKLVPLFHYGLRTGGFLCLGMAEALPGGPELFDAIDKNLRVFRRREVPVRPLIDFPLSRRLNLPATALPPPERPTKVLPSAPGGDAFERMLLEEFTPASAIVNQAGEILFRAGRQPAFLRPAAGLPSNNLLDQVRGPLRRHLSAALLAAGKGEQRVIRDELQSEVEGDLRHLRLTVRPVPGMIPAAELFAVIIEELEPPREPAALSLTEADQTIVDHLERELRVARTELQATVEELESANEELKSSNEELLSTNEELQSANEELQTSQEELKAVNEELAGVNAELQAKLRELRIANDDLKNLFASTEVATVFLDLDLRITRFTPAVTALFRLRDSDVGRPLSDLAPTFEGADLEADARSVLATLSPMERQVHARPRDRWFVVRTMPYRTLDEGVAGVVTTFTDVTPLKHAAQTLERQASLLRNSYEPILTWRIGGGIEFWNRGAEELYGYGQEEALGRLSHELLRTTFPLPLGEVLSTLRREGRWEGELRHHTRDGRALVVLTKLQLVREEDGTERVLETNRDVTERVRLNEERRRLAGIYRALSTAQPTVVLVSDARGRLIEVSPLLAEILEQDRGQLVGQEIDAVLPPAPHAALTEAIRRFDHAGESEAFEMRFADRHFASVVSRIPEEPGLPPMLVVVGVEVTSLVEAQRALRASDQRKTEFLAMLSHELRTPLTPIRNSLALLERSPSDGPAAAKARAIIARQTDHLARLVDDLLDMARIVRGAVRVERHQMDLTEVVRQVVQDHRSVFDHAGIALELAGAERPLSIFGDEVRIAQVLSNLLTNAAKFTPRGGVTRVTLEEDAGQAVLRVRDSGQGISPEVLPRLFEIFAQADTSLSRTGGGLGLGLSLAKSLVVLHGGTIEAHSEGEGRGAELIVRLPLLPAADAPAPAPPAPRELRPRRILYIEDNRDSAESMASLLELLGHEVHLASTGEEGLVAAQTVRPEIVLCDIGLPGMDGYAVARALRADPALRGVTLIAVSGYSQPEDIRKGREAGFDAHLAKPHTVDQLEALIASPRDDAGRR